MPDRFTMHHPSGGSAETTQAAYDRIWFARGWRKRPTKTSSTSVEGTQGPAPAGSSATSGDTDDTQEE